MGSSPRTTTTLQPARSGPGSPPPRAGTSLEKPWPPEPPAPESSPTQQQDTSPGTLAPQPFIPAPGSAQRGASTSPRTLGAPQPAASCPIPHPPVGRHQDRDSMGRAISASLFFPSKSQRQKKTLIQRPGQNGSEICLILPCLEPFSKPLLCYKHTLSEFVPQAQESLLVTIWQP